MIRVVRGWNGMRIYKNEKQICLRYVCVYENKDEMSGRVYMGMEELDITQWGVWGCWGMSG